jgi:hypothetical protein
MKRSQLSCQIFISIFVVSLILLSACEKKEDILIEEEPEQVLTESSISDEQPLEEPSERQENLDELLKLVLEKEKELKEKEKNLQEKLADLEEKEALLNELNTELKKAESKFKNFRQITYVFLILGLACILAGLLMIIVNKRPKLTTPVPEIKPEKKARKGTTSKLDGETEAKEKKSPKPVAKTKKITTEKKPKK